ncbi:Do family serine endopeptidase [Spirochaetia bacterium 38H-sp]|uniref:Do family serine endopeptidase n=1 Tax=Rarispira pelagica TaxID=3141764 RepID=A0ABU9UB52_9SPIR
MSRIKKIMSFNLILMGALIGALAMFFAFSCSTQIKPANTVNAESTDSLVDLEGLQNSFRIVSERALPVVTEISVVETKDQPEAGDGTPWFDFFFDQPDNGSPKKPFKSEALGSGVIVEKRGSTYYVVTNNHVIGNADKITIRLYDDRTYPAEIVGKDERKDLALISFKSKDSDIQVAKLGDSDNLHVGDWVLAIGNPFGFDFSVTAGIVSALNRRGGPDGNISDFIQTDAAINKGNSGGALVNLRGEVIGINTWITSPTGGSIGLGFAIPINNIKKAIADLIEKGSVEYGWLGVSVADPSDPILEDMGIATKKGAFVFEIFSDSPADKSGIKPGDFITKVGSMAIRDSDELVLEVGDLLAGQKVDFTVIRQGEEKVIPVTIGKRSKEETIRQLSKKLYPGFSVFPLTDEIKEELPEEQKKAKGIIVVSVEQGSKAAIGGLRVEDIITKVNGKRTETIKDFYKIISESSSKNLELSIMREGMEIQIKLDI